MRPVTLTVAGMRSYRAQKTLDFTDRTLMAILGDTGSGKSSLLEALYGALYGGSTWDDRGGLKAMIADGVQTLQIELVFHARGQQYTVARSTSRKNYPPSKHVFNGPGGEHLDGEKAVNARIVQLIGLTGQEFLRVVILPQGRFGQLLQGTAGERTPILRGILGLGVLDRVREAADTQASELHAALEPIIAARARLYPNPQAIAAAATSESTRHQQTVERLGAAATLLRDLDGATRAVSAALPPVTTALEAARSTDLTPAQQALTSAEEASTALTSQEQELGGRTKDLEAQDAKLAAELAAAIGAGTTAAVLATMASSLTQLSTTLPALTEQARAHALEQSELTDASQALQTGQKKARAAAELVTVKQTATQELETAARAAADTARQHAEHSAAVDEATTELAPQRVRLSQAATSTLTAARALQIAASQLAQARAAQSAVQGALTKLRDANAAAHIAAQHQPGQPCPVCTQALPATFSAPAIVGESELGKAEAEAEGVTAKVVAAERQAERAKDTEQHQLLGLAQGAATAATRLTQLLCPDKTQQMFDAAACASAVEDAIDRIISLAPEQQLSDGQLSNAALALTAQLSGVTGVTAAEQLAAAPAATLAIADVNRSRDEAAATHKAAQDELTVLIATALRLGAEHDAAASALERRQREYQAASARTGQLAQQLARDISALPALLSGPLVNALGLTAADPGAALLASGGPPEPLMRDLRAQIAALQDELDRFGVQRDDLTAEHRRLDGQRTALRESRTETVDRPRAAARRTWERAMDTLTRLTATFPGLVDTWTDVAAAVSAPALPAAPAPVSVDFDVDDEQLHAEVLALRSRLDAATAHAQLLLAAAANALKLARERSEALLEEAATGTLEELREQLAMAKVEHQQATAQAQRATAQVPVAEGLDVGISALTIQLKVLHQVKDLLSPSAFPQYVVEQRQVALLRIASSLFGKLTRDGYGFGEDFMIVDRRTGQPRPAKTLSGGETFLASLALALALVEVSNRSGGQLDCLFLDEGFGSLDSSILGETLDVLRLQATGGRLVGVISHLHAVAAELDDVLVVTKEVEGSTFRWLDPDERDAYLLDEAAAGLLS